MQYERFTVVEVKAKGVFTRVKLLHRYSLGIVKRCILVAMKNRNLNDKELQLAGVYYIYKAWLG